MSGPVAVEDVAWLLLDEHSSAGAARRAAERLAQQLALPPSRVGEVGLAVTEMATNVHRHGDGGEILLRSVRAGDSAAVEVVTMDAGPGMVDVGIASRDGHSTLGTLGIGLGAVTRLADQFDISSRPGRGTVSVARFEADRRVRPTLGADAAGPPAAGITRALAGESVCGDAYAVRRDGHLMSLMICDGTGHGPLAAAAARQAVRAFTDDTQSVSPPEAVIQRIHRALIGTRGGAVAVAELDPDAQRLRFIGIGNIAGVVVSPSREKRGLVSISGIAGYRKPLIRPFEYALPADSIVILHSDGVSRRRSFQELGNLVSGSPLVTAAALLRDAGIHHDDACVLVGKANR